MKRLVTWGIIGVAILATMANATAQSEGPVPEPLPFGPETSKFFFYGTVDFSLTTRACHEALKDAHDGETKSRPYATNNAADPCGRADQPTSQTENYRKSVNALGPIEIWLMPPFAADTPLDTSQNIAGEVTLFLEALNPTAPNFGSVRPKITFEVGDETIGTWDGAGDVVSTIEGPETSTMYLKFAYDFGAAPETLPGGPGKVVINITNSAPNQDFRAVGQRFGIAVDEGRRGHMVLPFTPESGNSFPTPEAPEEDDGNETGNETTGNETVDPTGNETGNTTAPTPTNTTAANNTTTAPSESGLLPGFEVVAVVSASLIALAYVARERRRPPVQVDR